MEGFRAGSGLAPALRLEARPLHHCLKCGDAKGAQKAESPVEHVLLRIIAGKEPEPLGLTLPRLTAVLVIDVSGSMQGTPIAQVKDAVARVAAILGDEDSLGV